MKLNRTGSNWNRLERNKINENWDIIEGSYNDVVGQITDEVVGHLIDSARLDWKEPVDTVEDLSTNAEVGETRMVREADPDGVSYVYRYDGENWEKIQAIDVTLVNEVDRRLSRQLADEEKQRFYSSMINRKNPTGMITWVDDDGRSGFYHKLKPLAEEYGVVFTSAVITKNFSPDYSGTYYLTYEHMKDMQGLGCEFISHTHNHERLEQLTDDELYEDFITSQKIMKKYGFNYRGIVYPFGTYDNRAVNIARQLFDYAIGTSTRGDNVAIPPIDNYDILRTSAQNGFERVKAQIDRAADNNAWLILTTHVDAGDWYSDAYARQIIEYALSKGLEFVTTQEGINAHGNIAQFGSNSISADGQVFGDKLGRVVMNHGVDITSSTPITYFKQDTVTHSRISANRGGFPDNLSGMLETVRYNNDLWSYQKFITTRDKKVYYRYWDTDSSAWTSWINNAGSIYLGENAVGINDAPTIDILKRRLTHTIINRQGNVGFPENKSGTLVTNAYTIDGFAYQEYHIYQSHKIYKRFWNDNAWSNWKLISGDVLPEENNFTFSTPISDFPVGKTYSIITSENPEINQAPTGRRGVLETTKLTSSAMRSYSYQEYKVAEFEATYRRWAKTATEWGSWKEVVPLP